MKLNKRQKFQLQFWKRFQGIEKPTLMQFISSQPRMLWVCILGIILIYSTHFYFFGYDGLLTGVVGPCPLFLIVMYARFRRDWFLIKHCLDWEKVQELSENIIKKQN